MSTTLASPETVAIRAINTFFLSGFVLDILASLLAFLTIRWLERLTKWERGHLEAMFSHRQSTLTHDSGQGGAPSGFFIRGWGCPSSVRWGCWSSGLRAWWGASTYMFGLSIRSLLHLWLPWRAPDPSRSSLVISSLAGILLDVATLSFG